MGAIRYWLGRYRRWMDQWRRWEDLGMLWPACKDMAMTRDGAKAAFLYHINNDMAWTRYYTEAELIQFVDDL